MHALPAHLVPKSALHLSAARIPAQPHRVSAPSIRNQRTEQDDRNLQVPHSLSLPTILCLCIGDSLPLHIGGRICSAIGKRHHMIDNVTCPAVRISSHPLEFPLSGGTPLDQPMRIACSRRREAVAT